VIKIASGLFYVAESECENLRSVNMKNIRQPVQAAFYPNHHEMLIFCPPQAIFEME
jgi:hypothetical protein